MTASKLSPDIPKRKPAKGCSCKGVCTDTEKCSCARLNGNVIPYVHNHGGRYDFEQPEMIQYLVSCVVWVIFLPVVSVPFPQIIPFGSSQHHSVICFCGN
jgi:hypothetical protein